MKRRYLGLLAVGLLVLFAGCSSGQGEVPTENLLGDETYEWDRDATVAFNISDSSYTAVYNISNQSTLDLFSRASIGGNTAIDIRAIRFRFTNGTVVTANHSRLNVTKGDSRTTVSLPANYGKVAYAGGRNGKEFSTPVFLEGSYDVRLPKGARVGVPFLSRVGPGGFNKSLSKDRVRLTWRNVTGNRVHARWYLKLDFILFTGVVVLALVLGVGGSLYYVRKIRALQRRREEIGLDMDIEDDDIGEDGPPPGMR